MSAAPHASMRHPLVEAYLADLDAALTDADPRERAETLTAVSEHIDDFLTTREHPTTEDILDVLGQLGSVDQIAASTGRPTGAGNHDAERRPRRNGQVLMALAVLSLAIVVIAPWLGFVLAVATLAAAVLELRATRTPARDPLTRAAAAIAAITLGVVVVITLTLLGSSSRDGTPEPAQTVAQQAS